MNDEVGQKVSIVLKEDPLPLDGIVRAVYDDGMAVWLQESGHVALYTWGQMVEIDWGDEQCDAW